MVKSLTRILALALAAFLICSCDWCEREPESYKRVVLMYCAAYSNLSSAIQEDADDFCQGGIPGRRDGNVLLIYAHHTAKARDYTTPTEPVLYRAYKDRKGNVYRDTLAVYPSTDVSSTPEVLHKVMTEVADRYKAEKYGLMFSSHGRGWLPVDYSEPSYTVFMAKGRKQYPPTRWLGIELVDGSGIDIRDLADALPVHLEFFLMDACLMGSVEVAYELRKHCDYLLISPAEILTNGFVYTTMASNLFGRPSPDLEKICREYYEYYQAQSGVFQSATVSLVDCRGLDALASVCAGIIAAHRGELDAADRSAIQPYFYNELHWFYDMRDIFVKAGATPEELERLDGALAACLPYTAATEKFFDLELKNVCGLSMYYPYPDRDELNAYYKTLAWNKATGLIQ